MTVESTGVDRRAKAYYDRAYKVYRDLYAHLKGTFREIGELVAEGL